ncbi:MAG: AraC family transcriptional regulator [Bacteroidota bacterium]
MTNQTHIERLKQVRSFVEANFKREISTGEIADIAFYSYRNINRVFKAVYKEPIGSFIKRLQIEDLAKEVLYTEKSITEIAYDAGYNDLQAFNKAFKSWYDCSPMQFRKQGQAAELKWWKFNEEKMKEEISQLSYREESIPDLNVLSLPYQGSYKTEIIEQHWQVLLEYADQNKLLNDETLYFGEVLDDEEIAQPDKCRYNCNLTLPEGVKIEPKGFMEVRVIPGHKYAVFTHQGSYDNLDKTYELIYAQWLMEQAFELVDKPVLEFYMNDELHTPQSELLTEIYVPIQ